ncbi:GNAT family N-acetyltransferase [Acetobacterium woodii]|uniref:Acetyltransferase GNAT family n=1 Tax=Acetobacterium woodii (strain ATCC 29683 / DSM 1030 / JCM 2381 / KCTC 1655 / WB1) TaxID=931626 RepID=H6LJH3_ACEWD|nr:GNAT family N-acetyltransferase [Acetobacterium woodii]AFA49901.1 acetyltransferase GNAT family [Acetobacterium woodii DSM 1030]
MSTMKVKITNTITENQKIAVAKLFYEAFTKKFSTLWLFAKNEAQAIAVLCECINYEKGLYAISENNILGFIGLETGDGLFVNFKFSTLTEVFGFLGATWRFIAYGIYRLLHNNRIDQEVHIDPIVVSIQARGMGVGTQLLNATIDFARSIDRKCLFLEVVDTNPEAQKLYKRIGFSVITVEDTRLFTSNAGFYKVIHMKKFLAI